MPKTATSDRRRRSCLPEPFPQCRTADRCTDR